MVGLHPNSIQSFGQAQAFAASFSLDPCVAALFGDLVDQSVRELADDMSGVAGWQLTWKFHKRDVARGLFPFGVNAFIPHGQRPGRAAEVVLDAFRRFLDHELREGLLVGGERVFDPHHLDRLETP